MQIQRYFLRWHGRRNAKDHESSIRVREIRTMQQTRSARFRTLETRSYMIHQIPVIHSGVVTLSQWSERRCSARRLYSTLY